MPEKEIIEKIYKIFLKNKSISTDSRKVKENDIFFALSGENFNGNIFIEKALKKNITLAIMDDENIFKELKEKYHDKIILVKNTLKTLQDLAKRYRKDLKIPFLGITGSNGKTTTKELIREVLLQKYNVLATEGNLNNHIGVPLTILSIKPKHNFAIIEMGANHIREIELLSSISKPNYGLITNIGIAHIGEFGNFENIIKTKKELYDEVLENNGKIFINSNDKVLNEISSSFTTSEKIPYIKATIINSDDFLRIEINKNTKINLNLTGDYNIFNVEAAYTIGKYFKIEEKDIVKALENYKPTNNRSQKEITKRNNKVIWDCYNANPSSMSLAISSFLKNNSLQRIFILGDMKELGKYSEKEHLKILEKIDNNKDTKILIGDEFSKLKKDFLEKKDFIFLKNINDLENFLKQEDIKDSGILVKGSNSIKLFNLQNNNLL